MTFIFDANCADHRGLGIAQETERIRIQGDVRSILPIITDHPLSSSPSGNADGR
jgi:hypothetical protein